MHRSSKNNDFIDFCHFSKELIATWSNEEGAFGAYFEVMYQSLIQIENQTIFTLALNLWKIWCVWRLQRLVPTDGCTSNTIEWREVGILLEFLNFFTRLDDVVPHLPNSILLKVFESTVDHGVQRPKGSSSYH